MSQQLDTLRLLNEQMDHMCDELWDVQRETPEGTYLWECLEKAFQALADACGAANEVIRREVAEKKRIEAKAEAHRRYVEGLAPCDCSPFDLVGVCAACYVPGDPNVTPCCTGTAVLAGRACPRCSS